MSVATSESRPAGRGRFASALASRDLRTLILAFIVDGSASWAYTIVLTAYVFERTGSPGWVTALATARWISAMVFGAYGGLLADRFDRRTVLVVSALASAVVTVGMAVIVGLDGPLWLLLLAATALGAVTTPVSPASGALIPEVVPESDLIAANAIFALLEGMIVVVGPAIGGLLLLTGHPVYGVLINTAGFLLATVLYLLLRVRSRGSAEPGGNLISQWFAGISTLTSHRRAFVLTVFLVLDSAAISGANVMMPALAEHLGGGTTGYSLLIAANALGSVIVAGLANKLAGSRRIAWIILVALYLQCVPLWISVFVGSIPPALVLMVISGVGMVIVDVLAFTALQRDLPSNVLGRVLGTINVLILGGSVLTAVLGSVLYAHLGLGWALGVIALAFPTIGLLGLPLLRGVDREAARAADLEPRLALLEKLDLFVGASRGLLEQVARSGEERTVPAGETIIREGEASDALWLLADGELAISVEDGHGVSVGLPAIAAPGYVGELGLMNRARRSATVTTAVDCRLLRIPGEDFVAALETAQPSAALVRDAAARMSRTTTPSSPVAR
jgi:MFS family permease